MKVQYSISLLLSLTFCFSIALKAQQMYFPPTGSDLWETIDPQDIDWCQESVEDLIALNTSNNTKALIILKSGKVVIEEYFDDHTVDKNWYWASAGKTITAANVGIAQEEGLLSIEDLTATYLSDWTVCDEANNNITIRNQLSMTTGLDYNGNQDCTDPECLDCLNEPGTEWYYHNAPYTLLGDVVASASGQTYNAYTRQRIADKIGMVGLWVSLEDNTVYFSTARSMARFGLMMLARGDWNGEQIISDKDYFDEMINPSQELNKSYGYLWWLNGKESYRLPGSTFTFNGSIIEEMAQDAFMAIGKNGQYIVVIPSEEIVMVRMGDNPDGQLVPLSFLRDLMTVYDNLACSNSVENQNIDVDEISMVNTIVDEILRVRNIPNATIYQITNRVGTTVVKGIVYDNEIDVDPLKAGMYFITFYKGNQVQSLSFYKG